MPNNYMGMVGFLIQESLYISQPDRSSKSVGVQSFAFFILFLNVRAQDVGGVFFRATVSDLYPPSIFLSVAAYASLSLSYSLSLRQN